MREILW